MTGDIHFHQSPEPRGQLARTTPCRVLSLALGWEASIKLTWLGLQTEDQVWNGLEEDFGCLYTVNRTVASPMEVLEGKSRTKTPESPAHSRDFPMIAANGRRGVEDDSVRSCRLQGRQRQGR